MAKLRIDLRKTLRAVATAIQDANADRLLSGRAVRGGEIAPRRPHGEGAAISRRKRVRVLGLRLALADLAGRVGVATGAMLRDLTKRSNIKIGRTSFKIIPSADVFTRTNVFTKGAELRQTARPFSGISAASMSQAASDLAADANAQMCNAMQEELDAARSDEGG